MRKIIVSEFVSLDGVIQAPGGAEEDTEGGFKHGGWTHPYWHDDIGELFGQAMSESDALLLGRKTWQGHGAAFDPMPEGDPFGDVMKAIPKYVVSTTLTPETATWNRTEVIADDIVDRITELKQASGRELQVHGSWQLAQTLHSAGLIDIYRLLVFPVVVGAGKRLFDDSSRPVSFEVLSQKPSGSLTALELRPGEFRSGTVLG